MNIDDFIVPSSVASPAGVVAEVPVENLNKQSNSHVGIPIARKDKAQPPPPPPAQPPVASMPKHIQNKARTGEFDYVQRRVRKTSIDERSVSCRGGPYLRRLVLICLLESQTQSRVLASGASNK